MLLLPPKMLCASDTLQHTDTRVRVLQCVAPRGSKHAHAVRVAAHGLLAAVPLQPLQQLPRARPLGGVAPAALLRHLLLGLGLGGG